MIYTLSVNSFNNTFAVKENGTKLTHFSGKRFKLFPFIANNNSDPIRNLDVLVGRYLSQIEQKEPVPITAETSVYKGYKQDKIEMRGDRAEMSDFPLYLNTVAGGLDCRDQTIGGFSFVVKIYAVPVIEIIG